jgi:aminopeptidase N
MRVKTILILSGILCIAALAMAQDYTRQDFIKGEWEMKAQHFNKMKEIQDNPVILDMTDYDVKYIKLALTVTNISGQVIRGRVDITSQFVASGVTTMQYDMHSAMIADTVRVNGVAATYTHSGAVLNITLDRAYNAGEMITTTVAYHGTPAGGGFGSFTFDTHGNHCIVSSLSEPEGAREWWPCKDQPHDKADSADTYYTVPDTLVATSNGLLVSNTNNGNGTRTFHWHISYPITTYLICISISNYQTIHDWYVAANGDSMPVDHYVYPELYDDAVTDLSITPAAIGVFAGMFGEYPFVREKYGHSLFPWGGAMEHQDNTSYGSMLIRGDHAYDMILVHELSHQWFGDMITCDIWPDVWMNEGFASYCEALYQEHINGYTAYVSYMRNSNGVMDPSGPIYDPNELFDGNTVYSKGSWAVHMLRGVMGDSAFFTGMRAYANDPDHMYGTITTRGFQHIMEQYYGADLGWYFDEWVWGQNRPIYRYSWTKQDLGNGQYEIFLHIRQIQTSPAPNIFTMPIRVYPRINNVDTMFTVWNDNRIADYRFVVNGNPTNFSFDKYYWILRDASSETYRANIVTPSLPDGYLNEAYSQTIEARGGTAPYHFTVQAGTLPTGLDLDTNTGVVAGTPTVNGTYTFTIRVTDSSSTPQTDDQEYTVVITDGTGIDEEPRTPTDFMVVGNYPNPFNSSTVIKLELPEAGQVRIDIFDILGKQIQTLYDGYMNAGHSEVVWNGDKVSSGVYLYKVISGDRTATRRMIMVK